jgi:hypothetical protein
MHGHGDSRQHTELHARQQRDGNGYRHGGEISAGIAPGERQQRQSISVVTATIIVAASVALGR